ncbi:hypothetical protein [uncultured Croceitalea sp.]|uniref:hypothetical protein n=1 Tax=uncultured Croceitalea sp. TaxID=1798908 RepID=UPI0033069191
MKTVLTLIAVIFFGTVAMAQEAKAEVKVETITLTVQLDVEVKTAAVKEHTTEVARLYMFKNSRIKKALAFKTKRDKAKMA